MKTTNIFYRVLCLTMMAFCSVCGMAQSEFGKVSPQTADFIRQGNIPVSLYTGQVNVSIPLYHIKDRDFDIPIALNYSGDGLKPNRRHGWAGLNWSVSGAGAISREIYGAPDDHSEWYDSYPDIEDTSSTSMATMGYYRALSYKTYDADDLYNFDVTLNCDDYECHLPYVNYCFYDGTPDLFLFSMPGHSGRFVSCANRILEQPICPNSYKFSLSGFTAQVHGSAVKASQITVTASDGYVYTFGSLTDTNALEYSFSFHPTTDFDSNNAYKRPRINAWHLTKITAPNGRTVKFNYTAATESTVSPFVKSDCPRTSAGSNTPTTTDDFSYSANRNVLLESIEIEDTGVKVEFLNGLESCRSFYNYGSIGNKYNALGYQLNGIRVMQDGTTVYTCSLSYENRNQLRFLKTVTATDGGVYTLEYNHPTTYPEPTTEDVDTYGYWTRTGSTAYSLLTKVSYPTGGNTSFGYERHTFNRAVKRIANDAEYSYNLVDSIGTLNAFRISQVTSTPAGSGTTETKEYTYPLWSDSSKDSGTLLRTRTFLYIGSNEVAQTANRKDDYNIEEPIIGYSSVQEKNADGSYKEYIYSDYQTCPDTQETNFHWHSSAQTSGVLQAFSTASLMTSRWDQRGMLVTERAYDSSGNRKRQVRYSYRLLGSTFQPVYTELLEHNSPYTTSVANVSGGLAANKITMQEYPLIMEETIDTQDNGNMTTNRLFYRNKKNLLSKIVESTSARDTLKTLYSYAMDNNAWIGTVWSTMHLKHMTDIPVSEQRMLNGETAGTRRTTFKSIENDDVVPDTVYVRKGSGAEQMEACYPVYDDYSNPVHVVYGNGTEEVLVWGYAGRYLVARIEGVSYNTVKAALGTAPEEVTGNAQYMDMLNALRTSLPDTHVTTYTYSPLVGVTEVTAPNNEKTTYTYDSMNRLYQVKDHNGNVVEQYNYNYQQ